MAKKKIEEDNQDGVVNNLISKTRKTLEKDFGEVFVKAESILNKERTIIPVSPKMDIGLSGGIPMGCWGIFSGVSGIGKSSMALHIASKAQKPEYGSRKCYYFDIEHRLEKKNLSGIQGLELTEDKLEIISSTKNNILTAEKALSIAEKLLKTEEGIVLVIDSSSALCTNKEYDGDIAATGRNEGPKLLAQFTRKLAGIVSVQDSLVIIIQHLIANTSGYGSPWLEDGGNKIVYQSDFKLRGVSFKKWEKDEEQIGQVNNWHVVKCALGQPNSKIESHLRYGYGIDELWESIELGCDIGLINKSGAWFELSYLDSPEKFQGQQNVWDHLSSNEYKRTLLETKIKEFFK